MRTYYVCETHALEAVVTVVLNHLIVPAVDKVASAGFLGRLLEAVPGAAAGPFIPVRINKDLTMDFAEREVVQAGHYAFLVGDDTFDALLAYLGDNPAIDYGSGPVGGWDRRINHLGGGRGVYVRDPDGHGYELFTAVP
jgi:catechol 2,3-dioxygenase-like lactoylglutathione lyase family enzyme